MDIGIGANAWRSQSATSSREPAITPADE